MSWFLLFLELNCESDEYAFTYAVKELGISIIVMKSFPNLEKEDSKRIVRKEIIC